MELSLFLARVFGLWLLFAGCLWAFRGGHMQRTVGAVVENKATYILTAMATCVLGLALIASHSVFELSWRGLITLLGYLIFLQGFFRLNFPQESQKRVLRGVQSKQIRWVLPPVLLILGAYLAYYGFSPLLMSRG